MNSNKKKLSVKKAKSRISNSEKCKNKKEESKLLKAKTRKKIWSVEALIESMKPSIEELKFREEYLKDNENVFKKSSTPFQCTKCLSDFKDLIEQNKKISIHPVLGVLMCQKCCDYYEDGEFSLDSDGEDKYCRWCGEGGTIFGCANCICGFCSSCVKRHFNIGFFKKVQRDDNWLCFVCNPKPLWPLRFICSQAVKASEGVTISSPKLSTSRRCEDIKNDQNSLPNILSTNYSSRSTRKTFRKRNYTSSSDESEHEAQESQKKKLKLTSSLPDSLSKERETESMENIKSKVLMELEKVLKLSEYQLSFGASWTKKVLKKLGNSNFLPTSENLANECQKIKWFLSLLSTYLVQFCNSLNSLEKSLLREEASKIPSDALDKNDSPYIAIQQFLGFINNQIKTFMEKGINLSDLIDAEVYDDENIIGIKKKLNPLSSSFKEKNINPTGNITNCTPNGNLDIECIEDTDEQKIDSQEVENKENAEEQKIDSKCVEKVDNSLDSIEAQNSEIDSIECDKENSSVSVALGMDLKSSDTEEDIQEILAILENA